MIKMQNRKFLSSRNLFLISQASSASGNFLPLGVAMMTKDIVLIGQVAVFQSLFTIFGSVTRSGIGFIMFKSAGIGLGLPSPRLPIIILSFLAIPGTYIYCEFSLNSDFSLFAVFYTILVLTIFQEYSRAKLIALGHYLNLALVDIVWLLAGCLTAIVNIGELSFRTILYVFLSGPLCSVVYIIVISFKLGIFRPASGVATPKNSDLIYLSAMPLITFLSVFSLNIIWESRFNVSDLGVVRGLYFFFVPIQFVLSVFPHIILKERGSTKSITNTKTKLVLILACAGFAIVWAYFSGILNLNTVAILIAISISMESIVSSQESALNGILENRVQKILLLRLTWAFIILSLGCTFPDLGSTSLGLALVIAFSDIVYRRSLHSRFFQSREKGDGH